MGRALEHVHWALIETHPDEAGLVREALLEDLRNTKTLFTTRHLRFVVLERWSSAAALVADYPALKETERLRQMAELLRDEAEAVRTGAARCVRDLTGGRVDPVVLPLSEVERDLSGPWRWDRNADTFVPAP
jgi:hypothetical protein